MKSQKHTFLSGEGNQWFERNRAFYESLTDENNMVINALRSNSISPKRILEIGSSNGKKLNHYQATFGAECYGLDPSDQAILAGTKEFPNLKLSVGTADHLPFEDHFFDVIIFGFCLYLCDRKDLFKIAYEADRCLADRGFIIIEDFYPPLPYKKIYKHKEGICSYKMDYSKLFEWNPAYFEIHKVIYNHKEENNQFLPDENVSVSVLLKSEEFSYPTDPYQK